MQGETAIYPNLIESIQEALQQQDKDELKNTAHALNRISENISALQMAEARRFLEMHHDEINDEPVRQVASELEDYYLALVKALSA